MSLFHFIMAKHVSFKYKCMTMMISEAYRKQLSKIQNSILSNCMLLLSLFLNHNHHLHNHCNRPTHVWKYCVFTWVRWSMNQVICNLTVVVNDNQYFFKWSHEWCLGDVSGKAIRVRNRGYFYGNVVVCDVLWNGGIIYRMRKFGRRVRWEG